MKKTLRLVAIAAAAAALLNLAGCATPATSQAMTVKPGATAPANPRLRSSIAIAEVKGGKDTNPLWTSQVDAAGFRKALTDSLAIAGYLAPDASSARYKVSADLKSLDQPMMGFTFDVNRLSLRARGCGSARPYEVQATVPLPSTPRGLRAPALANERPSWKHPEFINRWAPTR